MTVNGLPIEIKWAGEGWLRQVRESLADHGNRPAILVARRMSLGAREMLSKAGIGWIDETGAAEIAIGSLIVSRTGLPKRPEPSLARWTPSVFAVAEALLLGTRPTVTATASATGLSAGGCTAALTSLVELGLLKADAPRGRASGRQLADRDKLLDAYAAAVAEAKTRSSLSVGITWRDVLTGLAEAGRLWDKAEVPWAVTGAAGSLVLAPYLTTVNSAEVFVGAETIPQLQVVAETASLRPIEGGRLRLSPFPTETTRRLATRVGDLLIAPWPRVYADLRITGVRGEEAAEHLREIQLGR